MCSIVVFTITRIRALRQLVHAWDTILVGIPKGFNNFLPRGSFACFTSAERALRQAVTCRKDSFGHIFFIAGLGVGALSQVTLYAAKLFFGFFNIKQRRICCIETV